MTSTPLKNVGSLMNYVSAGSKGNTVNNLAQNFTDAFSKASGQPGLQNMSLQNDKAIQSTQVKVNKKELQTADTSNPVKKADQTDVKAETKDVIEKAGDEVVAKVAEELGITEEEVRLAMETLGLTVLDLFHPDTLTALVLTLTGEDMLSLMTDEGLYNSLQNLLNAAGEISEMIQTDLNISPEEMAAIIEKMKAEKEAMPNETLKDSVADETEEIPDGQKDYSVSVEEDGEVVKVDVKVDGSKQTESTQVTSEKVQEPEAEMGKENTSKKDSSSEDGMSSHVLLNQSLNKAADTSANITFQDTMTGNAVNTQDIMNQIMDYMKIQIKTDLTQMEIQLHPANLGTVNINIASKEGVITAQFLAQNEVVKAAIESQIVQLKNNFEEQGLKVESVEVTVASHKFERNLSGESNSQEQSTDRGRKKGSRKINLDELSLEETELDEGEQIAVEMMTAGGNTVDYMA